MRRSTASQLRLSFEPPIGLRRARTFRHVALGLRGLFVACAVTDCHAPPRLLASSDAGASPLPSAAKPAVAAVTPARLSRPIAAAAAPPGVTFVAGLDAARGVVVVTLIGVDGATRWTTDLLPGVAWSANATLTVMRSLDGAIVVWRGPHPREETTLGVAIGADGKAQGEPFVVGAAPCATDTELAWLDHGPKGSWRVQTRGSATVFSLPEDREPVLYCGAHRVFALGDGDDDVTLQTWPPGAHAHAHAKLDRLIEDIDFRGDEERSHELYAVGDVLGVVRLGAGGSVASREVSGDHRSAWRRLGRKLTDGDDVVVVDADATLATLAFTRDAAAPGEVSGGSSVEAFAWERAGTREVAYQVAPPEAGRVRGPFWSGAVTGGVVIGWPERPEKTSAADAPILGMSYRVVSLDALGEPHRVERPSDELVDAGCDDVRCYAVALARAPGEDGGQPELVEVLRYP
jgi:hypothetical protein